MGNIFNFIEGLRYDHRNPDNVTMKVKHFSEVPDSKKSYPMLGQIKKDGVYCMIVKLPTGCTGMFSRTGKRFSEVDELEEEIQEDASMISGVYITELCCDLCPLEVLSGMVNPNRVKPLSGKQMSYANRMYLAFHDFITIEEFVRGRSDVMYHDRYNFLKRNLPMQYELLGINILKNADEVRHYAKFCIIDGEEGVVLKPNECWCAGHKGYRMMKLVKGVHYDLKCTGWEEGTGKYKGKVVNLLFAWKNGKELKAMLGKGWSHEDAKQMFKDIQIREDWIDTDCYKPLSPVGKIFHVYALQESSKGLLRLPKVGELRVDKFISDVEVI